MNNRELPITTTLALLLLLFAAAPLFLSMASRAFALAATSGF